MPNNDTVTDTRPIPDWALLATVFVTGACVLIIELMGTRVLAPYFGSGIYTWSALIAVTLAALALGYAFGGRLADRLPRADILYNLCLAAGLWTLSTPMLARPFLPLMIQLPDIRVGVLIASLCLYSPNLFLLGAIGPFVIRLMARDREHAGSTSGRVFAVSTVGSLLGALVTGFVLIPNFGVLAIFAFGGSLLLAVAILGNFRPKFIGYAAVAIAGITLLTLVGGKGPASKATIELLDQAPSFYGQLQVIRKHDQKSLLVDGIGQNYIHDDGRGSTAYINFIAALPTARHPTAVPGRDALVIGLGAGQLPMMLQAAGLDVEAVEIDPRVGEMATRQFGLDLSPDQLHYLDGRVFLLSTDKTWDYIVIDAFNAEQIAWHLVTLEAFTEARARLSDSGVLAVNITSTVAGSDVAALQNTLKAAFPQVRSFSLEQGNGLTSIVLLGSATPIQLDLDRAGLARAGLADAQRFIAGELPALQSDTVLTDDFNPISHQRRQVQLLWRRAMIDYLGQENLGWLLL